MPCVSVDVTLTIAAVALAGTGPTPPTLTLTLCPALRPGGIPRDAEATVDDALRADRDERATARREVADDVSDDVSRAGGVEDADLSAGADLRQHEVGDGQSRHEVVARRTGLGLTRRARRSDIPRPSASRR